MKRIVCCHTVTCEYPSLRQSSPDRDSRRRQRGLGIVKPPSTRIDWPVKERASPVHSHTATPAISSGVPTLPNAARAASGEMMASPCARSMDVSITPGFLLLSRLHRRCCRCCARRQPGGSCHRKLGGVADVELGPCQSSPQDVRQLFRVEDGGPCGRAAALNNFTFIHSVEEGAREPVRLALIGDDGPIGTLSNENGGIFCALPLEISCIIYNV